MDNDDTKFEITNYIELRKNLWTGIIVLNGGLAGLFLTFGSLKFDISSCLRISVFVLGVIVNYFFFNAISSANSEIYRLINKLGDKS